MTEKEIDVSMSDFIFRSRKSLPVYIPKKAIKVQVEEQQFQTTEVQPLSLVDEEGLVSQTIGGFPTPAITKIVPNVVATDLTTNITITGRDFEDPVEVKIGGIVANNVKFVSPTTVTADAPLHAQGSVDVTVRNKDKDKTTDPYLDFSYQLRPLFTSTEPKGGPLSGGIPIIVYGTYFQKGSSPFVLSVQFNDATPLNATIISDIEAHVTLPYHPVAEWVSITLTNKYGLSKKAPTAFLYAVDAPPPPTPPPSPPVDYFAYRSSGPPDRPYGWHNGEGKRISIDAMKGGLKVNYTTDLNITWSAYGDPRVQVLISTTGHMANGTCDLLVTAVLHDSGPLTTASFSIFVKDRNSYLGVDILYCGVGNF